MSVPRKPERPVVDGEIHDGIALPVLVIDHASWRVLAANEAALRQYGYSRAEFVGLPVVEVRPPEGRDEARSVLSQMPHGFWRTTAVEHMRRDGSRFFADVWSRDTVMDGRAVRVATVSDVTERVQLQRDLQQAQKMDVLGQLAGGIAHQFNNALATILGGSELLMEDLRDRPEAREDLATIRAAAERAAALTGQLLAFSRRQVLRVEVSSLADLVKGFSGLLRSVLDERVELELVTDGESWPVSVDPAQLEQVVLSLVVNAQDAMPDGGRLVLSTRNVTVAADDDAPDPSIPPGDYAELAVRDTGVGMDEMIRERVFEPFFTTKPPPAGTGLGLSVAYGVVRQSGGEITVESVEGEGTTFRIFLPRAPGGGAGPRGPSSRGPREGETVLVVDVESAVRSSVGRALRRMGYVDLLAGSAREALAMVDDLEEDPVLLVTEVALPEMSGRDLFGHLRERVPGLRVLFLSGYATERDPGPGMLRKPFPLEALAAAVRRVMAGDRGPVR